MASLRDTLANLVEQYKASDTPLANLMRGDKEGVKQAVANALQQATQDPYSGLNVLGTTKLVGKTAQELAHEVAQKNAVEMLGLHPENTAMERAKALGFDTENMWYRGDKPNLTTFDPYANDSYIKGNIFLTNSKDIAKSYSKTPQARNYLRDANDYGVDEGVYSLYTKNNPRELKIDAQNNSWAGIEAPKAWKNIYSYDGTGQIDDLALTAREKKYPSMQVNNVVDQYGLGNQKIMFNPSDIRSINAAFDPARAKESDLLAGAMALPIATDKDKRNKIIDLLKNK